jgi:hypothetical protein
MASGVIVNPDCTATFLKMAAGEKHNRHRYIIFKIENGKEIVVEKFAAAGDMATSNVNPYDDNSAASYEEFLKVIKEVTDNLQDCRYAVFDFKFTGSRQGAGSCNVDKIVFLQICPDGAPIKKKMVYASSASSIKQALGTGNIVALQISDESQLSHRELLEKLSEKYSDRKA